MAGVGYRWFELTFGQTPTVVRWVDFTPTLTVTRFLPEDVARFDAFYGDTFCPVAYAGCFGVLVGAEGTCLLASIDWDGICPTASVADTLNLLLSAAMDYSRVVPLPPECVPPD